MQDGQRNGDYGNADSPASSENRQVEGNPGNGSPFGRILNGIPSTPNKQVRGGGIRDCFPTTISELPKAEGLGLPGMTCGGPLALHPVGYAP